MASDKLIPDDPRVKSCFATLNGVQYHYLLASPQRTPRATIFLIHGWPDFSFGWRNQIIPLVNIGLRVVVPDMMGYNLTSAPTGLEYYTFKRASDDMAALAKELNAPKIVLLGHDWGGAVVYRIAMWYPTLISAIISVCTPYMKPQKSFLPLEELVKTVLPNFRYQVQLASGEVEQKLVGKEKLREFLNALYGGRVKDGKGGFNVQHGVIYENLPKLEPSPLLSPQELDYYAEAYAHHGLGPTLNWYRTRKLNFEDEKGFAEIPDFKIDCPTLFIGASQDAAIPPKMSEGMERSFKSMRRKEVDATHWALAEKAEECNAYIKEFLEELLGRPSANL